VLKVRPADGARNNCSAGRLSGERCLCGGSVFSVSDPIQVPLVDQELLDPAPEIYDIGVLDIRVLAALAKNTP
jgi:hypothetical protein